MGGRYNRLVWLLTASVPDRLAVLVSADEDYFGTDCECDIVRVKTEEIWVDFEFWAAKSNAWIRLRELLGRRYFDSACC